MNLTTRTFPGRWLACGLFLAGMGPAIVLAEEPSTQPQGPSVPVSRAEQVMEHILAAELAASDGDGEQAAKSYLQAALLSEEPEVAERATRVALEAQAWQYAGMAADRWTQLAPFRVDARQTAVRTFLVNSDYEQAAWQLSKLLEQTADTAWQGWPMVTGLLEGANNAEKAGQLVDRLIAEHDADGNPYAMIAKSQAAARAGDIAGAMEWAEAAVSAATEERPLHVWAGRLAMTSGDRETALAHFQQAWKIDPQDSAAALAYAELLAQDDRFDEAEAVLADLPDTPANRFNRVVFSVRNDQRETGLALHEGFAAMTTDDPVARAMAAAQSAELLGLTQEAIDWYGQLEGTAHDRVATRRRAVLLAQSGDLGEARAILQRARNTGRSDVRLDTSLLEAQLLAEAGQHGAAIELLDHAAEQFDGNTALLYTRALIRVEAGDIEGAENDLRTVLAAEPDNPNALNALGYTLADRTDRLDEAEALINAAYDLAPDQAAIVDSKGWIAFRRGRLEEAEAFLRQAFSMEQNAEIAAHLGEVLWALGRHDDARAAWDEGAAIDPDDPVLVETRTRLDPDS